jgi:FkbM family methyltransferase
MVKRNGKPGAEKNNSDKMQFGSLMLRKILHAFYNEGKSYKIPFGKLRGMKSFYRNDINFHVMMGLWEEDSIEILSELFAQYELNDKKIIVADVGANTGYYSLFFSRYLNIESKIFAFEPASSILDILKKNMEINHISNVQVLGMACTDKSGEIDFFEGNQHYHSSLLSEWGGNDTFGTKTRVKSISLDDFFSLENGGSFPDLIKMDIEGGGVYALKGL